MLPILTINQSVTYFKAKFPKSDYEEVAKAKFDHSKNADADFDLDIGWALRRGHSNSKRILSLLFGSILHGSERKHCVILHGIMNGLPKKYFETSFVALFTAIGFDFLNDRILGFMMNFSSAQINGFLSAVRVNTGGQVDGLQYLKGCSMHWMQSVQRASSNHNIVAPQKLD